MNIGEMYRKFSNSHTSKIHI